MRRIRIRRQAAAPDRRLPSWRDVGLALALLAIALAHTRHAGVLGVVLNIAIAVPLIWRRRAPGSVFAVIWTFAAIQGLTRAPTFADSALLVLCPEFRFINDGVEFADSYTFNPHKWMFTNFDCNVFYVADRKHLIQTLSVLPEYLRNQATESGAVIDYRDWHIQLGRRFRSLKLWFVIRHYGIEGLQHHIREHVRLAQQFAAWVRGDSRFELAAPAQLNLVCFRLCAGDHTNQDQANQDQANQLLMDRLNGSGDLYLTHTKLDGKLTLRFCVGQTNTQARHVERAWQRIQQETGKLGNP